MGWPTAMYLSRRDHQIAVIDNFAKRRWEIELGIEPLIPIRPLHERVRVWKELTGHTIEMYICDLRNYGIVLMKCSTIKVKNTHHMKELIKNIL